jgi:NB-ARC domain
MSVLSPAVHRAIVCVDVEGFGDRRRTNPDQVVARDGLYRALSRAFARSGMCWEDCYHEDRGDGALILVPSDVPKSLLVTDVLRELAAALSEHNQAHDRPARIRLRLAVHAGEICHDAHGVAGTAINVAFRLLEAAPLKRALAGSSGVLAVIASRWFFEEVVRHTPASDPASYRRVPIAVKETRDSAWICRPDDPYLPDEDAALPPGPAVAVPRQLPGAVCGFAGRVTELDELTGLLNSARTGGTVVISAIEGTAGIGKTALAVHWAHQVAGRFPDGQLHVNLRGFDPAGTPMTSAVAVRGFLDALDVPPERIPVSVDAQAALYRSLLAGRRVLVVLDNARDAGQVRPLLPGSSGCMVIVTSRNRLTSLIAEGARPLTVDLLTVTDARQLLAGHLGASRMAAEPDAVEDIITACSRLPLALAIVAARASAHPSFPLTALADELRDAQDRLEVLNGGEAAANARAVFSWSCRQLSTEAARLFRLLGLHPGPDITAPAAAALPALLRRGCGRCWPSWPGRICSPSRPRDGSRSTTCCALMPASKPGPVTPKRSGMPRCSGCWITTCTPLTPPRFACTRAGNPSLRLRSILEPHRRLLPITRRRGHGSRPNTWCCWPPSSSPPPSGTTATPGNSPP